MKTHLAGVVVMLAVAALVGAPAAALAAGDDITSIAVLPLATKGDAALKKLADVLDDLVLSALQARAGGRRVIGRSDIDTLIGFEKTKDMVNCDQVACAVEIAGALGVDSIVTGTLAVLGKKHLLTLVWIDQRRTKVIHRMTYQLGADVEQFDTGTAEAVTQLLAAMPTVAAPTPPAPDPSYYAPIETTPLPTTPAPTPAMPQPGYDRRTLAVTANLGGFLIFGPTLNAEVGDKETYGLRVRMPKLGLYTKTSIESASSVNSAYGIGLFMHLYSAGDGSMSGFYWGGAAEYIYLSWLDTVDGELSGSLLVPEMEAGYRGMLGAFTWGVGGAAGYAMSLGGDTGGTVAFDLVIDVGVAF